jgi:hypothetical protein
MWKEIFDEAYVKLAKKLTYRERQQLPDSAFAIPEERKYPIHDLCLHGDTLIPLLSGEEVPIKDLVGKEVWVYAYDLDKRAIVPAKATNIRKTMENARVYKVKLDNGKEVICTGNHPFLTIDGRYVLAEELTPGTALMPFIIRIVAYYSNKPYLEVYQPWYGFWDPVHHMVCRETQGLPKTADVVVHHKDQNRFNNVPDNLEYMDRAAHCRLHAEISGYYHKLNLPTEVMLYANHKVVSVEDAGYADVYDLEVPGIHNFAISAGIFVHNSHAKNALARVSQYGTPEERQRVREAVYRRYPELRKQREERIGRKMTRKELREKKKLPKK